MLRSRLRDLAHYESFGYDHATFGLRVEGLTTTPYSGSLGSEEKAVLAALADSLAPVLDVLQRTD